MKTNQLHLPRVALLPILLLHTTALGCGGSGEAAPGQPAAPGLGAEAAAPPPTTGAETTTPDQPTSPASGTPATTGGQPAASGRPTPTPIPAGSAVEIRAALVTAAADGAALARAVDPQRGVGAWDRAQETKAHFCDTTQLANEVALGYELRDDTEWTCNQELTRCAAIDPTDR